MKLLSALSGGVLLVSCAAAFALPTAVVEAVRMPAWIERSGTLEPLAVGAALKPNDLLYTGEASRLLLRATDGSIIKLGENASLRLVSLGQRREGAVRVFAATLDVLKGAFRFTTGAVSKFRKHDVSIKIATITAGIRGTDVWGKTAPDRDLVCLIEGKIAVSGDSQPSVILDQPLTFYVVPKGAAPLPVAPVSREQMNKWAAETEIFAGGGAARQGGRWKVNLVAAQTQGQALAAYDRLRQAGYPAEIRPRAKGGKQIYQVRLAHLPSRQEAQALAKRLEDAMGFAARVSLD